MPPVDRLEKVLDVLRRDGGRITSARRAILRALIQQEGHATAEQLTTVVQVAQPDVHESTVYRFLDELERLGIVDHVHFGHGPGVYHFADDTHNHLVCQSCGVVVEVTEPIFDGLRRRLHSDFDFEMDPRHFAVPGRCRDCARAGG